MTDRPHLHIQNQVCLAQCACQLSKLDQENLQLKVECWKKDNPKSIFFFCPYKDLDSNLNMNTNNDHAFEQIHQEPWQSELMMKYGNTISLMDADYFHPSEQAVVKVSVIERKTSQIRRAHITTRGQKERAQKICRPIPASVKRGRSKTDWRCRNRIG